MAGAVLQPLGAQVRDTLPKRPDSTHAVPLPKADSLARDSLAKVDSLARLLERRRDTIQPPLLHAERPRDVTIARTVYWSRDSLYGKGALTLADLLDRVTGATTYHAGWISTPATVSYLGDFRHVRVFLDGMELLSLDPRSGGILDQTQVNLWAAEDATIEQTADETRVYLRTWRARFTTPVTRTDVSTGDQQTNMYRGFISRRYDNGLALQFGAQQYGTTPPSQFGQSSDQLGIVGRIGWANPAFSVDAFLSRVSRHRGVIVGTPGGIVGNFRVDSILPVESARNDAYIRAGFGDPDVSRYWGQAMATTSNYNYGGVRTRAVIPPRTPQDSLFTFASLDTNVARSQFILTGGTAFGPLRASATARVYGGGGRTYFAPSVRASFASRLATIQAYANARGPDSSSRADLSARLTPLSFVSLLGSVGRASNIYSVPLNDRVVNGSPVFVDTSYAANYARGELGIRLFDLWFLGGVLRRDSVRLAPPVIYDTLFVPTFDHPATAATAAIRGQLWRFINVDLSGLRWTDTTGLYRPQYQTRSEVFVRTNLLDRFPSGNLGILFSAVHEYRSATRFPVGVGSVERVPGYRTISTLLEIRILSATISWQFRNILGERYSQVPFFVAPRQTNIYGVRWEFFN